MIELRVPAAYSGSTIPLCQEIALEIAQHCDWEVFDPQSDALLKADHIRGEVATVEDGLLSLWAALFQKHAPLYFGIGLIPGVVVMLYCAVELGLSGRYWTSVTLVGTASLVAAFLSFVRALMISRSLPSSTE